MDFYYNPASPPCQSVLMVAKALGIKFNLKSINTHNKEHLTPEFLKINPQHTIPTLVDNGFTIWESRAILGYLVEQYGKNDSLYPKDPVKRAVVNQRLYFDMGTFFQRFADYFVPVMRLGLPVDPEKFKRFEDSVEFFDIFLASSKYAAGDEPTIADYSLLTSLSTIELTGYDFSRFKNIIRWYALVKKSLVGIEENEAGLLATKEMLVTMKAQGHLHKSS